MKILLLLDTFPKLSETFILNHITALIEMDVEIEILARCPSKEVKINEDVEKYNLLKKTSYFDPGYTMFFRALKGLEIFLRALVRMRLFPYRNPLKLKSLHDLFFVHHFINKKGIDIIHAHYGPNGLMGARLKEWQLFHGKLITSFHGYDLSKFLHQRGANAYRALFHFGDLFLPVSNLFKERLIELGCPPEKIVTHKMGIDPTRFTFSLKIPNGRINLLTVARLTEKRYLLCNKGI